MALQTQKVNGPDSGGALECSISKSGLTETGKVKIAHGRDTRQVPRPVLPHQADLT